jgi:hypothetical protein
VTITQRIAVQGSVRFPPASSTGETLTPSDQFAGAHIINCAETTQITPSLSDGGSMVISVKSNGHAVSFFGVEWVNSLTPSLPASGRAVFVIWRQEGVNRGFKHGEYET